MIVHNPVLLKESIEGLNLKKGDTAVDATLGGGGHSSEILKIIGKEGRLIAIDQDEAVIDNFNPKHSGQSLSEVGNARLASTSGFRESRRVDLVKGNFSDIKNILGGMNVSAVSGILADLGYSSIQLEDESYGMSFLKDAQLDMRLDKDNGLTAKKIINEYGREELEKILKEYGEEKFFRPIVKKIIEARKVKLIEGTADLVEVISAVVPEKYKHGRVHPATRTFQALRIAVNDELKNLEKFIPAAIEALRPGGRLVIISFHSLEDRIVKNIFRENARGCICPPASQLQQLQQLQEEYIKAVEENNPVADELEKALRAGPPSFPTCQCSHRAIVKVITKKPITASLAEIGNNPRARSAKLRICERI